MLDNISIDSIIEEGSTVVLSFATPIHILTLAVSSEADGVLRRVGPPSSRRNIGGDAFFTYTPLPDALPDQLRMAGPLDEAGVPAIDTITVGRTPTGYIASPETVVLRTFGTYHVVFIAAEGHGGATFIYRGGERPPLGLPLE